MMRTILILLSCLLISSFAYAQTTELPEIHEYLKREASSPLGKIARETKQIYVEALKEVDNSQLEKVADISYGPNALHKLDVHFQPTLAGDKSPVVVFVHGGGFTRGDKNSGGIYDNVLQYFAKRKMVGVNINFRLAPEAKWPGGAEDIALSIDWVRENINKYGGDPENIFVVGHSSGAAIVAGYLFQLYQQADEEVRGGILISGIYQPGIIPTDSKYYGEDKSVWEERAPITAAAEHGKVPVMLIEAEYDSLGAQKQTFDLLAVLCERDGRCPTHIRAQGHNHLSETYHMNTADESIGPGMLNFINLNIR